MVKDLLASIIINNYNYDRFLGEAIDSALAQTYSNVEVIIVDDGSTDRSREIILSYGNKIIPVFKSNGGQASAFNAGFEKSKGEVILFLDSDDVLYPGALKNITPFFVQEPGITKVQWPLWIVDENGKKTGDMKPMRLPVSGNYRDVILNGGPTSCTSSPTSGNSWGRHFLQKVFPMPEDVSYYKKCADEYLYTLAPVFGNIVTIEEPQGFYRIHGKNIYSALSFDEKLKLELEGHEQQTIYLSSVLRKLGFQVEEEKWRRTSWFHLLKKAITDIDEVIPRQGTFILVDDGTWDTEGFSNYTVLPFIEQDGKYWGPPESDSVAISELLRLKNDGADFIVFAKQCFWWFDQYPGLRRFLQSHFPVVKENEGLVIYDLKSKIKAENPLVSIIINNYNYGRFLPEAIDSALSQTYSNIEVIVVDDGSKDNSRDIIESYGKKIISVFKDNGGQGSAYNEGFYKSSGDIICNLDADDFLFPGAIEKTIPFFDNETVKVQWPLRIMDSAGHYSGELTTKWTPPEGDLKEMVLENGPFYDFNLHVGNAVKTSFLLQIMPMPEQSYKNGGDVYLTTLAPIFGKIRNCMEPLGTYRVHGSNNYAGRYLDNERVQNYIDRFETNSMALGKFAKKLGLKADIELWKERNFNFLWPDRLLKAKKDIEQIVPERSNYIIINENEWGEEEPVKARHAIPFTEKDGQYYGPPADDNAAIVELERLKSGGVNFLVLWWTSFWWFECYPDFFQFIKSNFKCILKNDRIIIYDIR